MENKSEVSTKVIQLSVNKDFISSAELKSPAVEYNDLNQDSNRINNVINMKQVEINKMVDEITSLIWK